MSESITHRLRSNLRIDGYLMKSNIFTPINHDDCSEYSVHLDPLSPDVHYSLIDEIEGYVDRHRKLETQCFQSGFIACQSILQPRVHTDLDFNGVEPPLGQRATASCHLEAKDYPEISLGDLKLVSLDIFSESDAYVEPIEGEVTYEF